MTEPLSSAQIAAEILRASESGPPLVSCTVVVAPAAASLAPGDKLLVRSDGTSAGRFSAGRLGASSLEEAVVKAAPAALAHRDVTTLSFASDGRELAGRREVEAAGDVVEVLLEVVEPPSQLLIVGGGHIGRALGELGVLLGMSVAVIDDREDYASPERFPFADQVICGEIEAEVERFPVDANTYAVMVSRGHKQDEASLRCVVGRGAAYVGMIGSKRRTRTVLDHLLRDGFSEEAVGSVFTPIGLDIGAETPEEIALAILAEIVLVRRGGAALPMSEHGRMLARPSGASAAKGPLAAPKPGP